MKLLFILPFLYYSTWSQAQNEKVVSFEDIVGSKNLTLSRADFVIGEHLVNMIKFTEKGYLNQEVLNKVIKEVEKSKNFSPFLPWLKSIKEITHLKTTTELITRCREYNTRKEVLPLERMLERTVGNYCRERVLEAIGRDIEKSNTISDDATQFIQENLKSFLTKKNKKNFAYFIQAQANKPEVLKKLSQDVTTFSVRNQIVPSPEILKDIMINEQITKLIQDKGFNPLQNQNFFYAEYGKLIQVGYKTLDSKPDEAKVKAHFKFLKNYLELNRDHLPVGLCLTRMNDFAKAVHRNGFINLARDIFKYIVNHDNKEIKEDAFFFYLWTYLSDNDFKSALKLAESYKMIKHNQVQDPRLKFWIGFSHESVGDKKAAIVMYEDVIANSPLSYYSIMSTKKLQVIKPDSERVNFYTSQAVRAKHSVSLRLEQIDEDHAASLIRLKAWSKMDSQRLMKLELDRLNLHSMPNLLVKAPSDKQISIKSDLHILYSKVIQESENYLATFRYLYQALDKKEVIFNRALLEVLYPQPFLNELRAVLKKDNIDPLVLLSLIRQESVFNPRAQSRVGARGLMQLMPATARRMKKFVTTKQLNNPKLNIELGTKYFKGLIKRYDGNLVYVLAAYNAGETRVERWKNLYFNTDETILKNIEAIPFLETRNYVKLIFRNIFFYKLLLLDDKSEIADSSELHKIYDIHLGFNK